MKKNKAENKKHFVEKQLASGRYKTACGIKVKANDATKTFAFITCKRCKDSLRAIYGTRR